MSTRSQTFPTAQHALRQLKLVVPGAAITYYLETLHEFWRIVLGEGGWWGRFVVQLTFFGRNANFWPLICYRDFFCWCRTVALIALGHGLTTIALFIYVLLTPWIKGVEPNVCLLLQAILHHLTGVSSTVPGGNRVYCHP